MYDDAKQAIEHAKKILVIQPDNPDGDSLGSAMALEEILGDLGKDVTLFCRVAIPKHLRFVNGWDRVTDALPRHTDCAIFVDTSTSTLFDPATIRDLHPLLKDKSVVVIDHHAEPGEELPFTTHKLLNADMVATGQLIFDIAYSCKWPINERAAEHMVVSILADSLGLTSAGTTPASFRTMAELVELGADVAVIEARRREFMKKDPEILEYKGRLLQRIEYFLDGQLAVVRIPWEEIEQYSDRYNPSALVIDEMRLVEGVRLAISLKTYPDGKMTGKIRANPGAYVAEQVGAYFGGGGHRYAAGFKVYDDYEKVKAELIGAVDKILREHDADVV
jgi:bifunctional oligoribonuclease and PAP phosphatase NrnA